MRHLSFAWLLLLLTPSIVQAHALNAECWVKGDQVEVKATFDDGTHPNNAKVQVLDTEGKEIASGLTDARGLWSFPKPTDGPYRVIVDAGAGHRTETRMTIGGDASMLPSLVSTGSTEEEFTRFKWLQVLLGLFAIAGFCAVLWLIQRSRRPKTNPVASGE